MSAAGWGRLASQSSLYQAVVLDSRTLNSRPSKFSFICPSAVICHRWLHQRIIGVKFISLVYKLTECVKFALDLNIFHFLQSAVGALSNQQCLYQLGLKICWLVADNRCNRPLFSLDNAMHFKSVIHWLVTSLKQETNCSQVAGDCTDIYLESKDFNWELQRKINIFLKMFYIKFKWLRKISYSKQLNQNMPKANKNQ